jgi:hypothetical protein
LLASVDAVVHLAGDSIAGRFTDSHRRAVRDSRIGPTRRLAELIARNPDGPSVLICASAVGYYGYDRGDQVMNEDSERGGGFLADVVADWEDALSPAEQAGTRVVRIRTGIVQSPRGGTLRLCARCSPPDSAAGSATAGSGCLGSGSTTSSTSTTAACGTQRCPARSMLLRPRRSATANTPGHSATSCTGRRYCRSRGWDPGCYSAIRAPANSPARASVWFPPVWSTPATGSGIPASNKPCVTCWDVRPHDEPTIAARRLLSVPL